MTINLTGHRYGKLVVLKYIGDYKWECICDCGKRKIVRRMALRNGDTKSCGCLKRDYPDKNNNYKHGMTKSPEYTIWAGMHARCRDKNHIGYSRYGGAGIKVCDSWADFRQFYQDMGPRPSPKHSIDRRDNSKGYSPDNCRWATPSEQRQNTRPRKLLEFCWRGHPYNETNTYYWKHQRKCRACRNEIARQFRKRHSNVESRT